MKFLYAPLPQVLNGSSLIMLKMCTISHKTGQYLFELIATASFLTTYGNTHQGKIWISEKNRSFMVFSVMGCKDVKLALTSAWQSDEWKETCYIVQIGDKNNKVTSIRLKSGGNDKVVVDTPGILSCNETRYFWVSWKDHLIEVGQGQTVGDLRVAHWQDKEKRYNVTAGVLYVGDDIERAEWTFYLIPGTFLPQEQSTWAFS